MSVIVWGAVPRILATRFVAWVRVQPLTSISYNTSNIWDSDFGDPFTDTEGILNLDSELIERAGECGLRSFVILLGVLDGLEIKPEILSYEGPFGVGYLVASFEVVS